MRVGAKVGRGHAEHLVRVHILYQGDYGSETSQVSPCSVKTSVQSATLVHWLYYKMVAITLPSGHVR